MLLAVEATGLTITVGQFVAAFCVFVSATVALIGIIVHVALKFGELKIDLAVLQQRVSETEQGHESFERKLDEIFDLLRKLGESVAVLADRKHVMSVDSKCP